MASPLAGRPYDLRHAAVSLMLNGGVPATEVAERAGHSAEVLLKIYAKCIDGQRDMINELVERLFAGLDLFRNGFADGGKRGQIPADND